jgi:hypothetical protein
VDLCCSPSALLIDSQCAALALPQIADEDVNLDTEGLEEEEER